MSFLIIGSNSQIGKEVLEELGKNNADIITISRSNEKPTYSRLHLCHDVTNKEVNLPKISEPLRGFLYLPGTMSLKPFKNLKMDDFESDLKINFLSMVRCLEQYLPNLEQFGNGSIVLISSVAAQLGLSFHSSISASKGAIEGFARAMAAELSPKIRVNVVAPSLCDTPLAKPILDRANQREISAQRHPLHRIGCSSDIAKMIKFLLTDDSSWITGQVHHVDGGLSTLRLL
jgi:NAD(P)-dependent dehydrogenase (short-subunit alcohol dehydrogenase family)